MISDPSEVAKHLEGEFPSFVVDEISSFQTTGERPAMASYGRRVARGFSILP